MPSTVTVTGKTGAGVTATAIVINNVRSFEIATDDEMLSITDANGKVTQVDIGAATTITCTVSGSNYTLTIS